MEVLCFWAHACIYVAMSIWLFTFISKQLIELISKYDLQHWFEIFCFLLNRHNNINLYCYYNVSINKYINTIYILYTYSCLRRCNFLINSYLESLLAIEILHQEWYQALKFSRWFEKFLPSLTHLKHVKLKLPNIQLDKPIWKRFLLAYF